MSTSLRRPTKGRPVPRFKPHSRSWLRRLRRSDGNSQHRGRQDWLVTLAPWATVLVAVAALVYTNKASDDQLRAQQEANRAQQQLVEHGQITERLNPAIEHI